MLTANPAMERLTGLPAETLRGQEPHCLASGRHDAGFFVAMRERVERQGCWQGEVWLRRHERASFPVWLNVTAVKDEEGEVTHLLHTLTNLSDKGASQRATRGDDLYDGLTGLPNRRLLRERLQRAIAHAERQGGTLAVLCLDLIRFHQINEALGYATGDELLARVAGRLKDAVRRVDTCARLGADEFLIVLEELGRTEDVTQGAQRILACVEEPYEVEGQPVRLSARVGVSLYPQDGQLAEDLIRNAATARDRERSEGACSFYREDMTTHALKQRRLEADLRVAIEGRQLELYYQPRVDVVSQRVLGLEALMRWNHPLHGLVSPGDFIPLAEETGLIVPMGKWALEVACQQARLWHDVGFTDLHMAVNLSPIQLRNPKLKEHVLGALELTGLPAQALELEITESQLIADLEGTLRLLDELRALGVRIALDDFGTGHSSLSLLRKLPLDALKIDKSFLDRIPHSVEDRAILDAIVTLGHSLSMQVVAEGVERNEQLTALRETGCDQLQGYLFSRPLPTEATTALLGERQ